MLERLFHLRAHGTTVRTEVIGGTTTFVTLSYIIFVQPAVLATTGMDAGAVMTATCLASAFATLLMGVWAKYPIAVAPAMGHNCYFAFMAALFISPLARMAGEGIHVGEVTVYPIVYVFAGLFLLRYAFLVG